MEHKIGFMQGRLSPVQGKKIQFFPWLESSVRYTENTSVPYNPGSKQTWKDKGIDLKVRLLEEGQYIPALAVGIYDVGGTGSFSSEFIVANKKINDFDFSVGIGWGRFGAKGHIDNPFGLISDDLKKYLS